MHQSTQTPAETVKQRVHIALAVANLEQSLAFYRALLGRDPVKLRPRYGKFESAEPALNLALNESDQATGPVDSIAHYGIQVDSVETVQLMIARFRTSNMSVEVEEEVACCYSVQTKAWITDPDGNRWEVFVVLADSEQYERGSDCCVEKSECCEPSSGCC